VFPAGQAEPQDFTMALVLAQRFLAEGNLAAALSEYSRLIEADQFLDNVIFDLRQSVYQHPDSQELWQTLGDAYMHADRLQDALEAYSRAEELLR
jgi:cytochrome c-type biogenesis protein CcmH/NrfG